MTTSPSPTPAIVHRGLALRRTGTPFLTEAQSRYALECLWALVAGDADWPDAPALAFDAADASTVQALLDAAPGAMPWVTLAEVAPQGWSNPLDTDRLPSFAAGAAAPARFDGRGAFPVDLVTATFLQLTRWEEWSRPAPDEFGIHDEEATVAARQGFRDRPVLDEWALVLRAWLEAANPAWQARLPAYRVEVSHDIDILRYYKNPTRILRRLARGLVKERRGLASLGLLAEGLRSLGDAKRDPCVTAIDDLMSFSESLGGRSTFFFMSARPGRYDEGYRVDTPLFRDLRDRIRRRGHAFGWHPGYDAAQDDALFREEMDRYAQAIESTDFGVRHHFLRWRAGFSWQRLAACGRPYDASVGYNHGVGFRASTARPYPAFDLEHDRPLPLEVRPLIVMDGPLQRHPVPMADHLARIAARCRAVDGCLTLLIHNYSLMNAPTLLTDIARGLRAGAALR